MDSESGSEHDASELFYDSLDEDTEKDDSAYESPYVEEMEENWYFLLIHLLSTSSHLLEMWPHSPPQTHHSKETVGFLPRIEG